jgi:hypothetical protein
MQTVKTVSHPLAADHRAKARCEREGELFEFGSLISNEPA